MRAPGFVADVGRGRGQGRGRGWTRGSRRRRFLFIITFPSRCRATRRFVSVVFPASYLYTASIARGPSTGQLGRGGRHHLLAPDSLFLRSPASIPE